MCQPPTSLTPPKSLGKTEVVIQKPTIFAEVTSANDTAAQSATALNAIIFFMFVSLSSGPGPIQFLTSLRTTDFTIPRLIRSIALRSILLPKPCTHRGYTICPSTTYYTIHPFGLQYPPAKFLHPRFHPFKTPPTPVFIGRNQHRPLLLSQRPKKLFSSFSAKRDENESSLVEVEVGG